MDNGNPPPTPAPGDGETVRLTIDNDDAHDGYVKAGAGGSDPVVGTLEGRRGLAIGRGSDGKYNRTVLSFDTSAIPDDATVTRAHLTVTRNSGSGDPWANPDGNTLVIDVKNGCFGTCTIETGDWGEAATAGAAGSVPRWTSGPARSGDFNAAGLSAIDKTGTTQIRLGFLQNPTAMHYLFVGHGPAATLHVEYRQ